MYYHTSAGRASRPITPPARRLITAIWLTFLLLALSLPNANASITSIPSSDLNESRLGHTATMLPNGEILVAGGNSNGAQNSVEIYTVSTDLWRSGGTMNTARGDHTATLLSDGRVLVAGGYNGSAAVATAEIYDPATGNWSATAMLNMARYEHTATLLPTGHVVVIGGISSTFEALDSAEIYDPATNSWSFAAGVMAMPRYAHTTSLLTNGTVMAVGGLTDDDEEGELSTGTVEIYNPQTQLWSSATGLTGSRYAHTATVLENGKVLVAGGIELTTNRTWLASAEQYDPATGVWSSAGSITIPRSGHTAAPVIGSRVLLVGGLNSGGRLASNELYDPATNTWSVRNDLINARNGHSATALAESNLILVAGGSGINGASLASVELYDPGVEIVAEPEAPALPTATPTPIQPEDERNNPNNGFTVFMPVVSQ